MRRLGKVWMRTADGGQRMGDGAKRKKKHEIKNSKNYINKTKTENKITIINRSHNQGRRP